MKFNRDDAFVSQAYGICEYISQTSDVIWDACKKAITSEMKGVHAKRIYISGCGDSYCAGMAMEPAFTALLGEDTVIHSVRMIDISRRFAPHRFEPDGGETLVILISASGKPSRVVEGAKRAALLGAHTLAVTSGTETPLGAASQTCVVVPKPNVLPSPGLLSYVCSCLTLAYTAVVMGCVRGKYSMEQALAYKSDVEAYCASYAGLLDEIDAYGRTVAEKFADKEGFDFFADRSGYATAYFAGCKYMELFGNFFTIDDSENWEHVNNFIVDTHNMATAAVVTDRAPSRSRVLEGFTVCERLERPLMIVTDIPRKELPDYGEICVLPQAKYDWITPVMMHLPFDFVGFYIAQMRGATYFRGFEGPWTVPNKIGNSEMIY